MMMNFAKLDLSDLYFGFAFFYPLFMAWIWIAGGIWFYFKREYRQNDFPEPSEEGCSIIIPCFNEEEQAHATIRYAMQSQYPLFEVIAVNDGSSDKTAEILDELAVQYPKLRVVHLAENQGKAYALRAGTMVSQYEFLVCIDGDALLHPHAVFWMMHQLTSYPRVGAVTGNPRIINRSSILGKLQVGEFSSIIGLIKRAQRTYGRIFCVSGAIAGFRKTALDRIGYWRDDMITEDIDVSWRLQFDHWDLQYVPKALCYIYMPETFKGLWKQRLRWSQGGVEVLLAYVRKMFKWRLRRMWPIAIEAMISIIWAYVIFGIFLLYFYGLFFQFSCNGRNDLKQIIHNTIVGCSEDQCIRIVVDAHDYIGGGHTGHMLHGTGDAAGNVEFGRDHLAGLAHLVCLGAPAKIHGISGGTNRPA